MKNKKYIPFLKTKVNEIHSLKELSREHKKSLTPFFDVVRKDDLDEVKFKKNIDDLKKKIKTHLGSIPYFYIDNYDIDSDLLINNNYNYRFVLEHLRDFNIIPVIAIDRIPIHSQTISDALDLNYINDELIALRLTRNDFEDYNLVEDEIDEVLHVINKFKFLDLVFDCRICDGSDNEYLSNNIIKFIQEFSSQIDIRKIIVTGSSIPAQINLLLGTNSDIDVIRHEIDIFNRVKFKLSHLSNLIFSDYTIVSPEYSDANIPSYALRNVMAPKIIYSYEKYHHIWRGNALSSDEREELQYNDIALILVNKPYYRGSDYSFGDDYIYEKSQNNGNLVTASAILKPTINAHITYLLNNV